MKADKKGNTGTDNTGENNSGYYNSGYYNSGYYNSGYYNSGDRNSGYYNSGDRNSGYFNSGYCNSGYFNSGDRNSGDRNSGDYNSGDCNSGDRNSGIFCTGEPDMLSFNKPTGMKLSAFRNSDAYPYMDINPCVWVETSMMTAEEKKANPTHETTGGYIKKLEYKEAWSVFWRTTTEANKKKFLALPNFDASIFKEITGIDVGNNEAKQKATELRKKADELLKSAEALEQSL